ncbi:cation:proton antiporter [Radiobacillus sp. PE A8.2]|uniref:cation:proton antiporter n=1 Tax=Radiobacillus sp. PE A8.2 TaxID=3380349 RepID=UPI00388DB2E3
MIDSFLLEFMIIGVLGVGSQWISWRLRLPAIVVMSIAGLLSGPIFHIINPEQDFGELYRPFISVAVAIILFEGSLNLDIKEIRGLGRPVMRIVTFGASISWVLGSLAAHYVAGLSWAVSFVIGAILIVTGPTVILPLLRQSKLKPRPAKILKWEGIIVDPFGALLAVFAFEAIVFMLGDGGSGVSLLIFCLGAVFAVILGVVFGKAIGWMFEAGHMPEFLKSPSMFIAVIACFALADEVAHETGLLAVTAMGMKLANMRIASIQDMRHFKENISMLLTSAIFVMLTASLTRDTLVDVFQVEIIGFVLLMLFIVRPLSIFLSTFGTDLTNREKLLVGWIAPRGIVALTVASYFASVLLEEGFGDAAIITSLTFALVFFTVCAHGFSIGWLARKLDLSSEEQPGILMIGSNSFTVALSQLLKEAEIPNLVTDSSWRRLSRARNAGINFHYGDILSEKTEYGLDMTPYNYLLAATENDSYNSLVCTTFVPEFGRSNVYKINTHGASDQADDLVSTIGGRLLFSKQDTLESLIHKIDAGHVLRKTNITNQYTYDQYIEERDLHTILLFIVKQSKKIEFFVDNETVEAEPGDVVISLTPPSKEFDKIRAKLAEQRDAKADETKEEQ